MLRVLCARAPSLISVRGPALRAGDMMVDGVIPLGEACGRSVFQGRPLGGGGSSVAGSRPRRIGVSEGWRARTVSCGLQSLLAELAQGVVAALEEFARDREAGAVAAEPLSGLLVVGVVG